MKRAVVFLFLLSAIIFFILFNKVVRAIRSDSYYCRQLATIGRLKYITKLAYNIIFINLNIFFYRKRYYGAGLLKKKKVLLLGASIAHQWYINEYFSFIENFSVYKFDKRGALQKYLMNKGIQKKPDAVIIKECAAFIPANSKIFYMNLDQYKHIYTDIIHIVKDSGAVPIAATVCPVAYKGTHLDNIVKFNDWIREYAENNGICLLDIEMAVRVSEKDRRLKKQISQRDGLHLRREAYENCLNPLIVSTVLKTFNINQS